MHSNAATPVVTIDPSAVYRAARERNAVRRAAEHQRREAARIAAMLECDPERARPTLIPSAA